MGWTQLAYTTAKAIQLLKAEPDVLKTRTTPDYHSRGPGAVIYQVRKTDDGRKYATVTLIDNQGFAKTMDETVGPTYYQFPAEWLAELDPMPGYSADWRGRVEQVGAETDDLEEVFS